MAREEHSRVTMRGKGLIHLRGQVVVGRDPHRQSGGSPLLNGMQKLLEGPEGCALTPDAQAAHVDHVARFRGTWWLEVGS